MRLFCLALTFAVLGSVVNHTGGQAVYFDRDEFLSDPEVAGLTLSEIDFDGFDPGTDLTNQSVLGVALNAPGTAPLEVIEAAVGVRFPMSTSTPPHVLSPGGSDVALEDDDLEIIFPTPIQAAGIDVVFDVADGDSDVIVTVFDEANNVLVSAEIPAPNGAPGFQFIGVVAPTPIVKRVVIDEIDSTEPDDHVAYDSIIFDERVIEFADFHDVTSFTLNGSAADINQGGTGVLFEGQWVLRLTDDLAQSGQAFLSVPFSLGADASFRSFFSFQITDPDGIGDEDGIGADGLVFLVQTEDDSAGGSGGGIGYSGIAPSVAVEFDTYNNGAPDDYNGNHVGIGINGNTNAVIQAPVAERFNNGEIWYAWVDYDGAVDVLDVRVSETPERPDQPILSYDIDLVSILGGTDVYLGFTSGTGGGAGDHDIRTWSLIGEFAEYPDLEVVDVSAPVEGLTGQPFEVTWTVTNSGETATDGDWTDRVYLSEDAVFDPGTDILLGSSPNPQSLDVGESYDQTGVLDYPSIPGEYWVVVQADGADLIEEFTGEGNNALVSATSTQVEPLPLPDLIVESLEPPPDGILSGSTTEVSFVVTNIGSAPTNPPDWSDLVFIARQDNIDWNGIDGNDAIFCNLDPPSKAVPNPRYLLPGESYEQTATFELPEDEIGVWYLYVLPTKKVGCHPGAEVEEVTKDNNVAMEPFTVDIAPQPDLIVSDIDVPDEIFSTMPLTVEWTVLNQGDGVTDSGHFAHAIYFSENNTPSVTDGDILLDTTGLCDILPLQPDESHDFANEETIKPDFFGEFYVKIFVDSTDEISEFGSETNNVGVSDGQIEIILSAAPDLIPSNIEVAASSPYPGHLISVTWAADNEQGAPPPFPVSWEDSIYLSTDASFDPGSDILLGSFAHASTGNPPAIPPYENTRDVRLPDDLAAGEYYLIVNVDDKNTVFEGFAGGEDNNHLTTASAFTVEESYSDLTIAFLQTPDASGAAGTQVSLGWQVTNSGDVSTPVGNWKDRIYFSIDETVDTGDAVLATRVHSGGLEPASSYDQEVTSTVPLKPAGGYFILALADYADDVLEGPGGSANNLVSVPFEITGDSSDLVVPFVDAEQQVVSGDDITVQWTVRNDGTLPTNVSVWKDHVWLSTDMTLGNEDDISLGARTRAAALAIGEEYSVSAEFPIPIDLSGTFYVFIHTDAQNGVFEMDDANNAGMDPESVQITLSDAANLVVSNIGAGEPAISGQPIEINWTVTNEGEAVTNVSYWKDAVYLSLDQLFDGSSDLHLGTIGNYGEPLEVGESYDRTHPFTIPPGVNGQYFVIVRTDSTDAVFESGRESDNVGVTSIMVEIILPDPSDLVPGSYPTPAGPLTMGESADFEWEVVNNGDEAVLGTWKDTLYLSSDPVWDLVDTKIGTFANSTNGVPLEPGESVSRLVTAKVPGVLPGDHWVLSRIDVYNSILETDEQNNCCGFSIGMVEVGAIPLELSEPDDPLPYEGTLAQGQERHFELATPAEETVRITLDHESPIAWTEMYVKFGDVATPGDFDFQFNNPGLPDQEIVIPDTEDGTYYVLIKAIHGTYEPGGVDFSLLAERLPLLITAFDPTSVAADVTTIAISGARFTETTEFTIEHIDSGVQYAMPDPVLYDASTVFVQFDYGEVPLGEYLLYATDSGDTTVAEGSLLVEPSNGALISIEIPTLPPGRVGVATSRSILIRNESNADAVVAYMQVLIGLSSDRIVAPPEVGEPDLRMSGEEFTQYRFAVGDVAAASSIALTFVIDSDQANVPMFAFGYGYSWNDYLDLRIPQLAEAFRVDVLDNFDEIYPELTAEQEATLRAALEDLDAVIAFFIDDVQANGPVILQSVDLVQGRRGRLGHGYVTDLCNVACLLAMGKYAPWSWSWLGIPVAIGAGGCLICCESDPCTEICSWWVDAYTVSANTVPGVPYPVPPGSSLPCCIKAVINQEDDLCAAVGTCLGAITKLPDLPHGVTWEMVCEQFLQSADPNEKVSGKGFGAEQWISGDSEITYVILFENVPEASAPAARVEIRDALDPGINSATFRVGDIVIDGLTIDVPENQINFADTIDLTAEYGVLVDILAGVNAASEPPEAFWILQAIDPDTGEPPTDGFTGFLPPEDGTGRGQGHVNFTIKLKADVVTGTVIENSAVIVFDNNEPIETNTVFNTIDAGLPESMLDPLPLVLEGPDVPLTFDGSDPSGGSGLAGFNLLVSVDGSPLVPFAFTTETEGVYEGEAGHVLGFSSRALDNAGNYEEIGAEPDAVTAIPDVQLAAESDSGVAGDDITNDNTPTLVVISAPLSDVALSITGGDVNISATVPTGVNGRGFYTVTDPEALPDGEYELYITTYDVFASRTIQIDTTPPTVEAWESVAIHGDVGEAMLQAAADGSFSEPRQSGISTVLVRYPDTEPDLIALRPESVEVVGNDENSEPIDLSDVEIGIGLRYDERACEIHFTPALPNKGVYCVDLIGVTDAAGNELAPGSGNRVMTALVGDATGDKRVNNTDVGGVLTLLGTDPIDIEDLRQVVSDIDTDGDVDDADLQIVLDARGTDLRFVTVPCSVTAEVGADRLAGVDSDTDTDEDDVPVTDDDATGDLFSDADSGLNVTQDNAGQSPASDNDQLDEDQLSDEQSEPSLKDLYQLPSIDLAIVGIYDPMRRAGVTATAERFQFPFNAATALPIPGWWIIELPTIGDALDAQRQVVESFASAGFYATPGLAGEQGTLVLPPPSLLVAFEPDTDSETIEQILYSADPGMTILEQEFADLPGLMRVEASYRSGFDVLDAVDVLNAADEVLFAEPDSIFTGHHSVVGDPERTRATVTRVAEQAQSLGTTAQSVALVAVLDDGVELVHSGMALAHGADFTSDIGDGGRPVSDFDAAGTVVGSSIVQAGGDAAVQIASARTLITLEDQRTWISQISWTLRGLNWADQVGARITNNSNAYGLASAALAMKYAETHESGMLHFAMAGDDPNGSSLAFPGRLESVEAVGALNGSEQVAWFSTRAEGLSYVATGVDVTASDRRGELGYVPGADVRMSGTGLASARVAGVAAALGARLAADADTESALRKTCRDLGDPGYDAEYGWGVPIIDVSTGQVGQSADVDGDGSVTVKDLLQVLERLGEGHSSADVNGDGTVDVDDVADVLCSLESEGL